MKDSLAASELINRAFGLAKKSAKPNWWIMALPVLKNRLLQLTNGSFKESEFGVISFRDFLQMNGETVRIDDSWSPAAVVLKSAEEVEPTQSSLPHSHQHNQVRPDLWRAILDYSSGSMYEWDAAAATARIAADGGTGKLLPTLSQDEMRQWKTEFLNGLAEDARPSERLVAWQEKNLSTAALPVALRPRWNSFLKHKVGNRLEAWFEEQHLAAPPINKGRAVLSSPKTQTEALRSFVLECVKQMSGEELGRISIPSSVALRVKSNG